MWIHTFIWCNKNYLLTEYNNKNLVITRRCLRIICVHYKHLLRSVLVALKDDTCTMLKFCCGNCWWGLFIFQFHNTPVSCYNSSSNFMLCQSKHQGSDSPSSHYEKKEAFHQPRSAQWIEDVGDEYPPLQAWGGWGGLFDSAGCLCPKDKTLTQSAPKQNLFALCSW